MTKEETIIEKVKQYLNNIVKVEGEIEKIIQYGNGLTIKFKNGTTYRQSFLEKECANVVLDKNNN